MRCKRAHSAADPGRPNTTRAVVSLQFTISNISVKQTSISRSKMSEGPGFVGIRFCQECNNMLYPKEDKSNKVLLYACRLVGEERRGEIRNESFSIYPGTATTGRWLTAVVFMSTRSCTKWTPSPTLSLTWCLTQPYPDPR